MKRSARNAAWIEKHCRVPEGRLMGQPLKVHWVQREILEAIYDTPTRTAIISMGRKNAKTAFTSCIKLLHLAGPEATPNSQLYGSAQSRKQAAVLFDLSAKIIRLSSELSEYIVIRDSSKQLLCRELGTVYEALSAEAGTKHGLSPKLIIHDELGQVRGPRFPLYDALETAQGAHDEPLTIIISTQAPNDADLLSVLIDDARTKADPLTKLIIYEAPEDADPFIEETWKLANPTLGEILSLESVRIDAEKAKRMPSFESTFRNLKLNQRVEADDPFIPPGIWQKCGGEVDTDALEGGLVYAGLDLSGRHDLTALAIIAEDKNRVWHARVEFFAPEKGLYERAKKDRAPYDVWAKDGWITLTPGASVDYEIVAMRLIEICDQLDVAAIGFDRWRIDVLIKELKRLGAELPLIAHGQGYKDMSPALDELESTISNELLRHGNNPVLTMCAANSRTTKDAAGNRKLDKARATGRIDGMVALAMARGVAAGTEPEKKDRGVSIYEQGVV
ncbi:hypothetical protein LCGC14_0424450 [marine sediment metagenome]|uniref:Terminase n=1 Tax=marine sediment metagenome TaxID=412755 RepID=A0A0F9VZ37_9ZZZZ